VTATWDDLFDAEEVTDIEVKASVRGAGRAASGAAHAGWRGVGKASKWNESLHPRDRRGRFIETGSKVKLFGGAIGEVVGRGKGDLITVRRTDNNRLYNVDRGQMEVISRPDGSAPTGDKAGLPKPMQFDATAAQQHELLHNGNAMLDQAERERQGLPSHPAGLHPPITPAAQPKPTPAPAPAPAAAAPAEHPAPPAAPHETPSVGGIPVANGGRVAGASSERVTDTPQVTPSATPPGSPLRPAGKPMHPRVARILADHYESTGDHAGAARLRARQNQPAAPRIPGQQDIVHAAGTETIGPSTIHTPDTPRAPRSPGTPGRGTPSSQRRAATVSELERDLTDNMKVPTKDAGASLSMRKVDEENGRISYRLKVKKRPADAQKWMLDGLRAQGYTDVGDDGHGGVILRDTNGQMYRFLFSAGRGTTSPRGHEYRPLRGKPPRTARVGRVGGAPAGGAPGIDPDPLAPGESEVDITVEHLGSDNGDLGLSVDELNTGGGAVDLTDGEAAGPSRARQTPPPAPAHDKPVPTQVQHLQTGQTISWDGRNGDRGRITNIHNQYGNVRVTVRKEDGSLHQIDTRPAARMWVHPEEDTSLAALHDPNGLVPRDTPRTPDAPAGPQGPERPSPRDLINGLDRARAADRATVTRHDDGHSSVTHQDGTILGTIPTSNGRHLARRDNGSTLPGTHSSQRQAAGALVLDHEQRQQPTPSTPTAPTSDTPDTPDTPGAPDAPAVPEAPTAPAKPPVDRAELAALQAQTSELWRDAERRGTKPEDVTRLRPQIEELDNRLAEAGVSPHERSRSRLAQARQLLDAHDRRHQHEAEAAAAPAAPEPAPETPSTVDHQVDAANADHAQLLADNAAAGNPTPDTPDTPTTPAANTSLADLEAHAASEGGTVLFHGGCPRAPPSTRSTSTVPAPSRTSAAAPTAGST
jgi:hypothetical protein